MQQYPEKINKDLLKFIIKSLRDNGLKPQKKIAQELGISEGTLSSWINRGSVSIDYIKPLIDLVNRYEIQLPEVKSNQNGDIYWKIKYYELLEKYNNLLERVMKIEKRL